ncbi:hypothetical protein [Bifidobacterium pseudolongum]|uniref:hypothetical protein n=1 Tax=Bifidobacterium pseudolongum TaxID=1694 RepID=UPI001021672D|nr:hypothetical protein [Bifidobacterium pseudolongum]RYQ69987.1 hypothetical protein PG2103B_0451 [Bifidobacterium pseudolongum subsp. globosum]
MDNTTNNNEINQQAPDTGHDGKLAAEAARRRVQAKEANERADAAEATVADLKAQIAALKLSQAKQAVTAAHPELTAELIDQFAPDNIDADGLASWASKALGLVVALRGEAPVDEDELSDEAKELAAKNMQIARMEAVNNNAHVTDEILDALCVADTPKDVQAWAAAFEQIATDVLEAQPATPAPPSLANAVRDSKLARVAPGKWAGADNNRGLAGVARKLQR